MRYLMLLPLLIFSHAYGLDREDLIKRRDVVKQWALECADGSYSEKIEECHQ